MLSEGSEDDSGSWSESHRSPKRKSTRVDRVPVTSDNEHILRCKVMTRIYGRIDSLDAKVTGRIDGLDTELSGKIDDLNKRLESLDAKMAGRIGGLNARIDSIVDNTKSVADIADDIAVVREAVTKIANGS